MRILLISSTAENYREELPPVPPLGLLHIASFIRSKGFDDIKVLNTEFSDEKKQVEYEISKADIVGVSSMTCQINYAFKVAELCRKYKKLSVIGGCHATCDDMNMLKHFDIVVRNEGEITFLEILQGKRLGNIKGISYRKGSKIMRNADREFINDINELPFPAWDMVDAKKYVYVTDFFDTPAATIVSSRGCPHACIFCCSPQTWKRRLRIRTAENVFNEILELHDKYGFKAFFFPDDFFTCSKERTLKLCDMILAKGLKIKWACMTRPNLDKKTVRRMKEAGCVRISIGVESASIRLLRIARKNYTPEQCYKVARTIADEGLIVHAYFIIGLPGETVFTFLKSLVFAKLLRVKDCQWTILTPFPGTEAYISNMVEIIEKDYTKWNYYNPVIRTGSLNPRMLRKMSQLAYIITSFPQKYWERYTNKMKRNLSGLNDAEILKIETEKRYRK